MKTLSCSPQFKLNIIFLDSVLFWVVCHFSCRQIFIFILFSSLLLPRRSKVQFIYLMLIISTMLNIYNKQQYRPMELSNKSLIWMAVKAEWDAWSREDACCQILGGLDNIFEELLFSSALLSPFLVLDPRKAFLSWLGTLNFTSCVAFETLHTRIAPKT